MITRREYILSQWDCLSFARDVLGLHVDGRGRAMSLAGQSRRGNEALTIDRDVWYDHKLHVGGGVIELCAYGMFDGDTGRAMEYLAGDFYSVDGSEWYKKVQEIERLVYTWHDKLLPVDREYLHSRRISDETIERLKIGSMTADETGTLPRHRITIPYFQNKQIVYYISRDRTGFEGVPKYQKCYLPREDVGGRQQDKEVLENVPWGLHTMWRDEENVQLSIEDSGINKREWLVIAEGAFDAISFEQEGYAVLSPMCGDFTPSVRRQVIGWCKKFKKVLVIFDNDGAGSRFTSKMCQRLFAHRINFYVGIVPGQYQGQAIKDVSDYYAAGGDLSNFMLTAERGIEYLAENLTEAQEVKEFLYQTARYAEKSDVIDLYQRLQRRKIFMPIWLKTVYEESTRAPSEPVIVEELTKHHELKHVEGSGFYEYQHGVWKRISDNRVKGYADELLGRYASNGRMTNIMKFAKARLSSEDSMNSQPIINLRNGVLMPNENLRLRQHEPNHLSTIQLDFCYDPSAFSLLWEHFIADVTGADSAKSFLLQEIAGYVFWPNNALERCFFLIGDGGNGKGVFMDTLREVFGRDNCSALPLSSFGGQFDPIMLQYSLVNFASENRVDLRGNIERIKEVTSGNDIVAAHKGVDAIKFAPRCKLITSCNDFFNTGDITHALMRRMCFVKFNNNFVQKRKADVHLKEKLLEELPGIFNWCLEGYLRLLKRSETRDSASIFTETDEDKELKREFMRTTNPVAYYIEDQLMTRWSCEHDTRELYREFKRWAEDNGYKPLSLGAFTNRIKRVMRELRPEVSTYERRCHSYMVFPEQPDTSDNDEER